MMYLITFYARVITKPSSDESLSGTSKKDMQEQCLLSLQNTKQCAEPSQLYNKSSIGPMVSQTICTQANQMLKKKMQLFF